MTSLQECGLSTIPLKVNQLQGFQVLYRAEFLRRKKNIFPSSLMSLDAGDVSLLLSGFRAERTRHDMVYFRVEKFISLEIFLDEIKTYVNVSESLADVRQ